MTYITTLPENLKAAYRQWLGGQTATQQEERLRLAEEGQAPPAMIIACCDSRLPSSDLFGGESGSSFIHRNVANLVPPPGADGLGETAAAVEYAVKQLKVAHLIVLGHSKCGGVQGCLDMNLKGKAALPFDYVPNWVELLTPALQKKQLAGDVDAKMLEQAGIEMSLENLLQYPFVKQACEAGALTLHGLWFDISDASLHSFDKDKNTFIAI